MHPFLLDEILDPATMTLERGGTEIGVARAAQGAAWDRDRLLVGSSSPRCGHVVISDAQGDDGRTYEIGPGAQGIVSSTGQLLVVHEAGTVPYHEPYFPVVAVYQASQLRDGGECILLPERDAALMLVLGVGAAIGLILAGTLVRRVRRRSSVPDATTGPAT